MHYPSSPSHTRTSFFLYMDMINSTTPFNGSLKRYLRRRNYLRLDVTPKDTRAIRLGGRRKRTWKIKAVPKLKWAWKIVSPLNLLSKLRDSYINMMLRLSGNVGDVSFGNKRIPKQRTINGVSKAGAFEEKLVFEIYKALKASQQFS